MTRLPTLKPREVVAALMKDGFVEHHQKGSHLYLWQPARHCMTTVPMHPGDLKRPLLQAILKQTGLTEGRLRELL